MIVDGREVATLLEVLGVGLVDVDAIADTDAPVEPTEEYLTAGGLLEHRHD